MTTLSPLSKRSKRILEEASRHLCFATKALYQLSIEEHQTLHAFCTCIAEPFDLMEKVIDAEYLGRTITAYLAEREQP